MEFAREKVSDVYVGDGGAASYEAFFRGSSSDSSDLFTRKASSTDLTRASDPLSNFSTSATPLGSSPTSVQAYLSDPVLLHKLGTHVKSGADLGVTSASAQPLPISSYQRMSSSSFNGASSPTGFSSGTPGSSPPPHLLDGLLDFPGLGGGGGGGGGGTSMAAVAAAAYAAESLMRGSSPPLPNQQQQQQQQPRQGQTIVVTSDTDAHKAAGIVAFLLTSQQQRQQQHAPPRGSGAAGMSSQPHCILRLQADLSSPPDVQVVQTAVAARVALKAAQVAHRSLAARPPSSFSGDVALVPFLTSDGAVSLLVIATCLPAAVWQAQGQVSISQAAWPDNDD